MDVKTITYFLKVCETKSISKAAREVYISPQGLNRAIRLLEKELGVPLVESGLKGIELTEYGERFEIFCRKVSDEFSKLNIDLSNIKENLSYHISIGIVNGSIITIGEDFFKNFKKFHPEIDVVYENGTDLILENKMAQGKYNLAIITTPFDNEHFVTIPLVYYNLYAWVHEENPLSNREELEIEDLKGQPLLTIGEEYKIHHTLTHLCHENGFEPNYAITTNDRYLLLPYTLQNYGISIALKREDIFIHALPIRSIPIKGYGVGFGICYAKDHILTEAEKKLIKAIMEKAANRKSKEL